tara:strand:- start:133 stop:2265 length:2133 start_codon:yes stop_codon:yes gene_type:complete
MTKPEIQIPFGAVYFRKSNPPREDWERDYKTAADDGLNVFRHWFMWSAIERRPGDYDWEEFDRQLELAAQNGLKTIIAELTHTVPDWAYRKFAHARQLRADGTPLPSIMGVSAATGGFAPNGGGAGTLTLNCPEVKQAAQQFLTALAERFKGHPGLLGYDVWNECNYSPLVDYSAYTKSAFREWLKLKYHDLETLAAAWYRYSYAEWEDIEPPVQVGPYPECLDWLTFKRDNCHDQMQFRIDTIRDVDRDCLIAAHGVAGAIPDMAARGSDDWLAASKVDVYGYTWIQARKGNQAWRSFYAADLNRAASRGKPFWHAERQGGPLWMQPQVVGRDKEDGRVAEPEDVKLWTLTSFAGGARGLLNLRYRPLLDGPLFGAFGSYGMDGSRTDRSDAASALAKWANHPEQKSLMSARPVKGDLGIIVAPETQAWDYLLSHQGGYETYQEAMWGAYRGFFDNNVQADWVHIADIASYDVLYFPYPIMLTEEHGKALARWVEDGGTLISEACPAYFGDRGRVGTRQPNLGLDAVFGVTERNVEFMPDIADRIALEFDGLALQGGGFRQSYRAEADRVRGAFDDGEAAVVENRFGKGCTLLIGTHPSVAYFKTQDQGGSHYFRRVLDWAERMPRIVSSNCNVQARLHEGGDTTYLWIVNSTRQRQSGQIRVDGVAVDGGKVHWGDGASLGHGRFSVGSRDALVVEIPRQDPVTDRTS